MYSERELLPWATDILRRLGDGVLYDCHTHVGLDDPAGLLATDEDVVESLGTVDSRALVFALKEPAGVRAGNDHAIELAGRHPGTLRALARLDPAEDPLAEAERCLDAGAAGLKLHPRGEGFELDDRRLDPVFALADERRLVVMVHAGVGTPLVGEHAIARAEAHPGAKIVLAHCAVGSFETVAPRSGELPNLLFDTSWWNPGDIWALLRTVQPCQVLYGSDIPFASPAQSIVATGRLAIQAGISDEQLHSIMGGQLERLIAGEDRIEIGDGQGESHPLDPQLERLYVTLCSAVEPMLRGEDPGQGLELARNACANPGGPHADVIESIRRLLELAEQCAEPDPRRAQRTPGFDLVLSAAIVARTPAAGVPDA
jgi:predicted TIM-barrel fold metal-dependent hydrolase